MSKFISHAGWVKDSRKGARIQHYVPATKPEGYLSDVRFTLCGKFAVYVNTSPYVRLLGRGCAGCKKKLKELKAKK